MSNIATLASVWVVFYIGVVNNKIVIASIIVA